MSCGCDVQWGFQCRRSVINCSNPNTRPAGSAPAGGNATIDIDDLLVVISGWGRVSNCAHVLRAAMQEFGPTERPLRHICLYAFRLERAVTAKVCIEALHDFGVAEVEVLRAEIFTHRIAYVDDVTD
jgi:hypothetical protein